MPRISRLDALSYHEKDRPGKIEVVPTKPHSTQYDLSLAYTPGVAHPCIEIEKNPDDVYKYTAKGNLVAVITNGTAVLGLGDIGPEAGKPVMEGKGLLFKIFADVDVFDIEVNEKDPKKFIEVVKAIAPTFGGINLEDIKAPECFEIEETLKRELPIPVFHDDQHGTAIITSAALMNCLELVGKDIQKIKVFVSGAGAAGCACAKMFLSIGVNPDNLIMYDINGILTSDRTDLSCGNRQFATSKNIRTIEEGIKGADVFLGVSAGGILTKAMLKSMAKDPIVFALANPVPEISYEDAVAARKDIIIATGRSDYPNQVNNVLGFPFIFRGALDVRATHINEEMKIAAAKALANLAKEYVPENVARAYNKQNIVFGKEYIIPKPLDPRLIITVSTAVAKAAMDTGVARKPIKNWTAYKNELTGRMGDSNKLVMEIRNKARQN
ncbi:MAG TPA: NADP-dependent malic enzyme, partial [Mariniphaga anaerophila]|nr:NADP-dependent malic enzyme [Mariniphaga anaerophila]